MADRRALAEVLGETLELPALDRLLAVGLVGGEASGDTLELVGSTHGDGGSVHSTSPFELDYFEGNTPLDQVAMRWRPSVVTAGAWNGAMIANNADIAYTNTFYIYASLLDASIHRSRAAAGFQAFTLFNALPTITRDTSNALVQMLVLNDGGAHENDTANPATSVQHATVNSSPQLRAGLAGGSMAWSAGATGLFYAPKFSTVLGASIAMGTLRALHCTNPAVALFQPQAGTESMTAYYGVDVAAIPFGGNVPKVALRSAIAPASNARMIENTGGAESDFGAGSAAWDDNAGTLYGNAGDALIAYDGSNLVLDSQVNGPSASKTEIPFGLIVGGDIFPVSDFVRRAASTNLILSSWRLTGLTSGNMADGFGTALFWSIEDDTSGRVNIAYQSAERAGADNTGLTRWWVYDSGVASEVWNATANLLTVSADATFDGRTTLDAPITLGAAALSQLTADAAALALPAGNLARPVLMLDADANGPWTVRGIVNVTPGDAFQLLNDGANAYVIGHQDTGAAAADRIISATGADYTLHAGASVLVWYDPALTRWILGPESAKPITRTLHISGANFGKGSTAPTDVLLGTSPEVPALLFDAVAETASVYQSFLADTDRSQDLTLRIQFALVNAETNGDALSATLDYVVPVVGVTGSGPTKTSTQVLATKTVTTGEGLAVGDVYEIEFPISAADATNPTAAGAGIAWEFHLTNTTGVAAVHVLDADLDYKALH